MILGVRAQGEVPAEIAGGAVLRERQLRKEGEGPTGGPECSAREAGYRASGRARVFQGAGAWTRRGSERRRMRVRGRTLRRQVGPGSWGGRRARLCAGMSAGRRGESVGQETEEGVGRGKGGLGWVGLAVGLGFTFYISISSPFFFSKLHPN